MMRLRLLVVGLVLVSAGCTDSVETVTREYRAMNNEAIDALMMITTEAQAKYMTNRVFKRMGDRYGKIDYKLRIVKSNREKSEYAKEMLESDGFHIYLTDLQVNNQRLGLEINRLRNLRDQYVERERELLIAEGDADPGIIDPRKVCPWIEDLLPPPGQTSSQTLKPLYDQLTKPEMVQQLIQFPRDKVKDFPVMFLKFAERRKVFEPKRDIRLIW